VPRPFAAALAALTIAMVLVGPARASAAALPDAPVVEWQVNAQTWSSTARSTTTHRIHHLVMRIGSTATATSLDFRISRTPARSRKPNAWRYPAHLQGIQPRTLRVEVPRGVVVCLQARGRDGTGPVSAFPDATMCFNGAFGPDAFRRHGSVRVVRSPHYARGRALVIHPGGSLSLSRVPAGAAAVQYVSLPRRNGRSLEWSMPGRRRDGVVYGSGPDFPKRHQVPINDGRDARITGAIRYSSSSTAGSLPLEGVAITPPWLVRMTRAMYE
jgi:hypothetical protein